MSSINLKLTAPDGITRRLAFPAEPRPSWFTLASKVESLFAIPTQNAALVYIDADGDHVTLSTAEELDEFWVRDWTPGSVVKFQVRDLNLLRQRHDNGIHTPRTPPTEMPTRNSGSNDLSEFFEKISRFPNLDEQEEDPETWEDIRFVPGMLPPDLFANVAIGTGTPPRIEVVESTSNSEQSNFTLESAHELDQSQHRVYSEHGQSEPESQAPLDTSRNPFATPPLSDVISTDGTTTPVKNYTALEKGKMKASVSSSITPSATPLQSLVPSSSSSIVDGSVDPKPPIHVPLLPASEPPTSPVEPQIDPFHMLSLPVGESGTSEPLMPALSSFLSTLTSAFASHPELSEGWRNVVRSAVTASSNFVAQVEDVKREMEDVRRTMEIEATNKECNAPEEEAGRRIAEAVGSMIRVVSEVVGPIAASQVPTPAVPVVEVPFESPVIQSIGNESQARSYVLPQIPLAPLPRPFSASTHFSTENKQNNNSIAAPSPLVVATHSKDDDHSVRLMESLVDQPHASEPVSGAELVESHESNSLERYAAHLEAHRRAKEQRDRLIEAKNKYKSEKELFRLLKDKLRVEKEALLEQKTREAQNRAEQRLKLSTRGRTLLDPLHQSNRRATVDGIDQTLSAQKPANSVFPSTWSTVPPGPSNIRPALDRSTAPPPHHSSPVPRHSLSLSPPNLPTQSTRNAIRSHEPASSTMQSADAALADLHKSTPKSVATHPGHHTEERPWLPRPREDSGHNIQGNTHRIQDVPRHRYVANDVQRFNKSSTAQGALNVGREPAFISATEAVTVRGVMQRLNDMGFTDSTNPNLAKIIENRISCKPRVSTVSTRVTREREDELVREVLDELINSPSHTPRPGSPAKMPGEW